MDVLSSDLVEEKGEVIREEGYILDTTKSAKGDLFAVNG